VLHHSSTRAAAAAAAAGLGLSVLALFASAAHAAADKPDGVIASGKHQKDGVTLEITDLARTDDGFLKVSFRFRNANDKKVELYGGGPALASADGFKLMNTLNYVDPKTRLIYGIVRDNNGKGVPVSSKVWADGITAPANGVTPTYWAKLAGPDDGVEKVTFYFKEVEPIESVELPAKK
jgi:hypothetical protein